MTEPNPLPSLPLSERFPRQLGLAALIDPGAFAETRGVDGDRPGKMQRHRALELARRLLDAGVALPAAAPSPRLQAVAAPADEAPTEAVSRDLTQSELYAVLGLAGDLLGPDEALRVAELGFVMDRDRGGVVELRAKLRVDEAEAVAVAETFGLPAAAILEDPEAGQ